MIPTTSWSDPGTLSTIASITAAFGVAMLFFRVQRELQMQQKGELNWIPWADWLLLGASLIALLLVLLPLVAAHPNSWAYVYLPGPACAASVVFLAFYPFALLAHYQFILANGRSLPRVNPEPGERVVVFLAIIVAAATGVWSYTLHAA